MPRYTVDVKAFMSLSVEADSEEDAVKVADAFAENAGFFSSYFVDGYNEGLPEDTLGTVVPGDYGFFVDGDSDVFEDDDDD